MLKHKVMDTKAPRVDFVTLVVESQTEHLTVESVNFGYR